MKWIELPGSNFATLKVARELCERPRDYLLKMLEKSPEVDFIDNFRKEYGIELILDQEVQDYLENYAHQNSITLSNVLKRFLSGASALNYMGIKALFVVTKDMVQVISRFRLELLFQRTIVTVDHVYGRQRIVTQ